MNLMLANRASGELVDAFLNNNQEIDKENLLNNGYVAIRNGEIAGCFILEPVKEGFYWLKQLYITKSEATALPLLVEAILVLAKQNYAKEVYVNSHQPMVDILLEALQFHPQKENMFMDRYSENKGKWWSYQVS